MVRLRDFTSRGLCGFDGAEWVFFFIWDQERSPIWVLQAVVLV